MKKMKDPRDEIQDSIVDKYLRSGMSKATIVVGTGGGKSRILIKILQKTKLQSVLILVNSSKLKDTNWYEEFKKAGEEEYFKLHVTTDTYQRTYKLANPDKYYDLVVFDEADFIANTDKYSNCYNVYRHNTILGLTGFVSKPNNKWFADNLPVLINISTQEMQQNNLLNKVKFVFVKYELSVIKDVKIEYTKNGVTKHFYTSDNLNYIRAEEQIQKLFKERRELYNTPFEPKEMYRYEKLLKDIDAKIKFAFINRSNVIFKNKRSVEISKEIIEKIKEENPEKKILVFSKLTEQSSKICDYVYNGKQNRVENEEVFDNFISSENPVLGVCGKLDRGVNIPNLQYGIMESYSLNESTFVQRVGRFTRLGIDEVATIYVLIPYYRKQSEKSKNFELTETYVVPGLRKMLKNVDTSLNDLIDYTYG